jgi:hypothetical protein
MGLIPQFLRALHLELFTKPAFAEGLRDHHIFSEKIFPQARGDH